MAQVTYRANVAAKSFPFVSENFGRSVIVPQYDQNYSKVLAAAGDLDQDVGIPQLYYCHNVMPHEQGWQSIGYTPILPAISGMTDFLDIWLLRDVNDNKAFLGITNSGAVYVSDGTGAPWVYKTNWTAGKLITTAYVGGITYIYVQGSGCYKYDFSTASFVSVTLTLPGTITLSDITGVTYSAGYLILWTPRYVYWSSTLSPTDFVPTLASGAGGGAVESARGSINYCIPHLLGFIIGTADNCVAALYQNNSRYPFQFREIVNSGGLTSLDLVATDPNSSNLYSYTTSGLQIISTTQTQTVFADVTDFISGRYFEDFDDSTKSFITVVLNAPMQKKLSILVDRYLVISYGITELTHALVYDFTLKRFGKLKITHVQPFTYHLVASGILETPRQSLAFLCKDGSVQVVDFTIASPTSNGTAIFGRYQFVRSRLLQLDEVVLESVRQTQTFDLTVMPALDGKNTTLESPALLSSAGLTRKYGSRAVGETISLLCQGGFMLDSLLLKFNVDAKR